MLTVSNSLRPHGLQPNKLQCPWDFSGKNTGVGGYFLLQAIFPTQGPNLGLLHWQAGSLPSESPSQISHSVPLHISCTFPSHHEAPLSFLTDPLPSSHAIPPGTLVSFTGTTETASSHVLLLVSLEFTISSLCRFWSYH